MLFRRSQVGPIERGDVTLTVRRWSRPQAKPGGRYRVADRGLIEVDGVEVIAAADLTEDDARHAGFDDLAALRRFLGPEEPGTVVYRIAFHYAGPDDRPGPPASDADLDAADVEALRGRLEAMDQRSPWGAWTIATLRLIAEHPATRAADLAAALGRERVPFKADVRKLKRLGLTESLEVGYRLSPRGRAFLDALERADAAAG